MRFMLLFLLSCFVASSGTARADALACLIQPYQEAEIGSQVIGVLDRVMVERGDFVTKGQPVAVLNSDVERAHLASAKVRAEANADLKGAASNREFTRKKKLRTEDLYKKNFVSQQASDQAATAKQGDFYTLFNNTIVHQTKVGGTDTEAGVDTLQVW